MAAHVLTLTLAEEIALTAILEAWQISQPETTWTEDSVLAAMVASSLGTKLREIDENLRRLWQVGQQLPAPARAQMINALQGAEKARLQQLLP
jgi:hypothetical protein